MKTIEQTYPSNSIAHINELLELGKQTSKISRVSNEIKSSIRSIESIKVVGALLSYFSILSSNSFIDSNAFVRFAIQVNLEGEVFFVFLIICRTLVFNKYSCSSTIMCV